MSEILAKVNEIDFENFDAAVLVDILNIILKKIFAFIGTEEGWE